jgi:hypothetical protein
MRQFAILAFISCLFTGLFAQKPNADSRYGITQLFAGGGISINSINKSGSTSGIELNIDHPKSNAAAFIAGAKFTLAKSRNSIIILPAVRVYSVNSTTEKEFQSGSATYRHTSTFKAQPVIQPTVNIGYNIVRKQNFKWNVSGGLSCILVTNGEEVQSNFYYVSDKEVAVEREPNSMFFSLNAQTGFDIGKHLGVWLFYQPPTNTSKQGVEKKVYISSLQAGVCYYLKIK